MADAQFPLVQTRNLPVENATLGTGDYLLAVKSNLRTVRIPLSALGIQGIDISLSPPTDPASPGLSGGFTWDDSGVYTYYNGVWGKTPRMMTNWDDYTPTTRFLRVDAHQELSDEEKSNARDNIGIESATTTKEGLVRLTSEVGSNDGGVVTEAQMRDYVAEQVKQINIALNSSDRIANYQGEVRIMGPSGELILYYDSANKSLWIGKDVNVLQMKPKERLTIYDRNGAEETSVSTTGD